MKFSRYILARLYGVPFTSKSKILIRDNDEVVTMYWLDVSRARITAKLLPCIGTAYIMPNFKPATIYSPTPSPVQYHRPPTS